ncbi:MAG: Nif3-like dinuclear metal center hexameric protein [Verrucomicrobiota bacterium]
MISRNQLVTYLDELLNPGGAIEDPSNNGLQVEGCSELNRVIFGVDACQSLFDAATDSNADLVFVHHGLSWGGGIRAVTDVVARRLRTLLSNGVSLYASHLPLDMHPEVGHNAVFADELGLEQRRAFFPYHGTKIGWAGALPQAATVAEIAKRIAEFAGGTADIIGAADREVLNVGIVSGGGADAIDCCVGAGVNCLITGEFTHQHYHAAVEADIPVIAGGHYATETPGIKAVMSRVQSLFDIQCEFIDLPTGL